jgi:hypothetical protein
LEKNFKIISSLPKYAGEVYGYLHMDVDTDKGFIVLLDSYEGLHPDWYFTVWSESGLRVVDGEKFQRWIENRVCPPERQNIDGILKACGLKKYSRGRLMMQIHGWSDWDNYMFEDMPDDIDILQYAK